MPHSTQQTGRVQAETVALLESLGHDVEELDNPISPSLADDFILYYGFLTLMIRSGGPKLFDPSFDATALTPVVRGFGDHCRSNLAKLPGAIRRLRRSTDEAAQLFIRNDVVITPTVGQLPPEIGHFDTSLAFDELLPRVAEWVCFTPWNNVTGLPAVSLPVGHDDGDEPAGRDDVPCREWPGAPAAGAGPPARGRPAVAQDPGTRLTSVQVESVQWTRLRPLSPG